MSEILTQKDIDALLRGVTPTEGGQATDVVPYNFVRPPRVSRERRSALETVHSRYALSLQAMLSSRLRTSIDVTVASVEQVLFSEFLMSLGKPCAAFVFKVGAHDDASGVIDLSSDFAYCLVDRMFGGTGEPEKIERGLTPLEQTVVRSIAERMVGLLRESWQEHLVLASEISGFESDPEAIRIANPDDHVLVANLEIVSNGLAGAIAICLPMGSLESFFQDRSAVRLAGKVKQRDRASRPHVESCLQHARVTVSARLPALQLTTREVAHLEVGQVLHTGSLTDADIEVHVNGRLRFIGTLGQVRRRVGLRVTQAVIVPEPQRRGRLKEGRIS
jgi:flagellar motor switch protein FliM